jgi:hypothetical protein
MSDGSRRWESILLIAAVISVALAMLAVLGYPAGNYPAAAAIALVTLACAFGYGAVDRTVDTLKSGPRPERRRPAGRIAAVGLFAIACCLLWLLFDQAAQQFGRWSTAGPTVVDVVERGIVVLALGALAAAVATRRQRDALFRRRAGVREGTAAVLAAVLVASSAMLVWWFVVDRPDPHVPSQVQPSPGVVIVGLVAFTLAVVVLWRRVPVPAAVEQAAGAPPADAPAGQPPPPPPPPPGNGTPGATSVGPVAGSVGGTWRQRGARMGSNFAAGLLATVGLLPGLLAVGTIVALLLDDDVMRDLKTPLLHDDALFAIAAGCASTLVAWLVLGAIATRFTGVDRANPAMYRELVARTAALMSSSETNADATGARAFVATTQAIVAGQLGLTVNGIPGLPAAGIPWTTGSGYVGLWQQIHQAEESQFVYAPDHWVIAASTNDRNRLLGSNITNAEDLRGAALRSLSVLDNGIAATLDPTTAATDVPKLDPADARGVLRSVRQAIDEYKDDASAELVRLRRTLTQTLLWTGLIGYLILILLMLAQIPTNVILTGAGLFAVAVVAGLAAKVRSDLDNAAKQAGGEDYGLNGVRLLVTSMISGIAGVAGVVLLAIVASAFQIDILKFGTGATIAAAFDVPAHPAVLLAAAVFGIAPAVLIDGLNSFGTRITSNLASVSAAAVD